MSLPVFWMDGDRLRAADHLVLTGPEGHHAAVVRRIRPGETVELTDGRGQLARCTVVAATKSGITCEVNGRGDLPRPDPRITVVQALPKGDRGELAVELMSEVGVDVVVPWAASRCVTRWKGERGEKALRRWRATAHEAAKQSRRSWFPEVAAQATTADAVRVAAAADLAVVLHESAGGRPIGGLGVPASGDVVLIVGPEGGLTDDEVGAFRAAGATAARLGPTVMRTSTAGAVGAAVLLTVTPRWV